MKKKVSLIILLVLVLIILSGCAKVDYYTKINEDGSGEIKYIYSINKTVIENDEEKMNKKIEDMKENAKKSGFKIEEYADANTFGFLAIKKAEDITKDSVLVSLFGKEHIKNEEESKIQIKKDVFGKVFSQNVVVNLAEYKEIEELNATVKYTVELPIEVARTNANSISENRKILTWDLKFEDNQEIFFIARTRK